MKRILSVFVMIACLLTLFALGVSAEQDILATKFQDSLRILDSLYNYDAQYMVKVANDEFISWDDEDGIEIVPAAQYEAVLHKYFVIDDAMLQAIRTYDEGFLQYNAADNTYTLYAGGGFGGILPPREYRGYVRNGSTYDVYYGHLTYENLEDVLPEGTTLEDLIGDDWPSTYTYGGHVYESGPEGYSRIVSRDPYGRKYTVELNGDIVRIVSCVDYTEGQQPEKFDENAVLYDFPENNTVSIPDNNCFESNTTVIVEEIETGDTTMGTVVEAMETVAEKFVAYEFTATKNNSAVQPNGKLAVTFAIPEGYSTNVAVYYMAKNGTLEKLQASVNTADRTVTAELEHFSTYIVSDESTKPEPQPQPTDGPQPTDAPDTPDPTDAPDVPDPTGDPNVPDPTDDPNAPDPTGTPDPTGEPDSPDPTTAPETTPQPDDGDAPDYTGVIIAVVAVVVIAGGVAVFLVMKKKGNKVA